MASKRQQQYSRLLQKELGEIFQRDTKSLFSGVFITVTHLDVSPDLSVAKAYLSIMLAPDKQLMFQNIKDNVKVIRNTLASKIRKEVRIIPELIFYLDDSIEYVSKIDKLFKDLDIPPAKNTEE